MFSIPLYVLLFVYLIFLVVFVVFYVINVYHIIGSGTFTWVSFSFMASVLVAIAIISFVSWTYMMPIDWSRPLLEFGIHNQNSVLGL